MADIRTERLKRKMPQRELALAVGVSVSDLGTWERGLVGIGDIDFAKLATVFGCLPDDLRQAHERYLSTVTPGEGYTTAVADRVVEFDRAEQASSKAYYVLDLFCGAGGFSYGLEQSGHFQVTAGIDILADRIDTFRANHKRAAAIVGDLRSYPINDLAYTARQPHVVVAGAPCQGFSSIRPFRTLTEGDRRNSLFENFVVIVAAIQPEWCIFENVVGLLTHQGGVVLDSLLSALKEIGYRPDWRVLNAANYGLPQNRERLIVVGSKRGTPFPWPSPTHHSPFRSMAGKRVNPAPENDLFKRLRPAVTVLEAIGDLPPVEAGKSVISYDERLPQSEYAQMLRGGCVELTMHEATDHSEKMLQIIRLSGSSRAALPKHLTSSGFSSCYSRLDADKPSVTLTVNFVHPSSNKCIHPVQDRALTPREGARIQGFPDHFSFHGSRAQIVKQIGNAVPPLLGKVIGNALAEALVGEQPLKRSG